MGRRRKVSQGQTRTTLMRKGQVEMLTAAADRLGCDYSDLSRALVDMLFPLDEDDSRCRGEAAYELRRRQLWADAPDLIPTVIEGWAGREMALPLALARRPALIALVDETVRILRQLEPITNPRSPPHALPHPRWAADVVHELLVVAACPAVRVVKVHKDGRPDVLLVADVICPDRLAGKRAAGVLPRDVQEVQYTEPAMGLAELMNRGGVMDVSKDYPGPMRRLLRCAGFQLIWKKVRSERGSWPDDPAGPAPAPSGWSRG